MPCGEKRCIADDTAGVIARNDDMGGNGSAPAFEFAEYPIRMLHDAGGCTWRLGNTRKLVAHSLKRRHSLERVAAQECVSLNGRGHRDSILVCSLCRPFNARMMIRPGKPRRLVIVVINR